LPRFGGSVPDGRCWYWTFDI